MILKSLVIKNFKGIKNLPIDEVGMSMVITGKNATKKTTVYDAFLWLLFGRDSTGRKEFGIRPLDNENNPIKGLVVSVKGVVEFEDGSVVELKREHHERISREMFKGYVTFCWIDEVPKDVGVYQKFISSIIEEWKFKLLTDVYEFNANMPWVSRRIVLLDVIGKVVPGGFVCFIKNLRGREVDDYKKILTDTRKKLKDGVDEINPRIDEIQRGLGEYVGKSSEELENRREILKIEIQKLDTEREDLLELEDERQGKIDKVNKLKGERAEREGELKSNVGDGVRKLMDAKTAIEAVVSEADRGVIRAKRTRDNVAADVDAESRQIDQKQERLVQIRKDFEEAKAAEPRPGRFLKVRCGACGVVGMSEEVDEDDFEETKRLRLADIRGKGNRVKVDITEMRKDLDLLKVQLGGQDKVVESKERELDEAHREQNRRCGEIDRKIGAGKVQRPDEDDVWLGIKKRIEEAEKAVGVPCADRLRAIEERRGVKVQGQEAVNSTLVKHDRMKADEKRIGELENQEKELAQKIADTDKGLREIEEFKIAESKLIEESVNGKFKHVKFRLFKQMVKEGVKDCCDAMLNGIPYSEMSKGEKILVGIDIINVLSEYWKVSMPLFIDNAESYTMPLEARGQTVELVADKKVNKLKIEKKG